jgi:hypothetical protein
MSKGWQETLITSQVDGSALASSTTRTSLLPGAAKLTLPPNFFDVIGKKIRVKASGRISTVVTTPGTLTLDIAFGSVVVATTQAFALNVTAQTNQTWDLEWDLTCRAIGSSTAANMMHTGKWISRASLNAPAVGTTTGIGTVLIPETAPAVGTGFDSTASQVVDLFGTWSVSNAANSILVHQYELISLN